METTNWSITAQWDWFTVQNMLFTYDENEMEEHRLNKMNACLILKPQFLTLDYAMLHSGYSRVETALYGFIQFFLSNNEKFYCTNQQLAEMLCVSETSISLAIKKLKEDGLIDLTFKTRANWWKTRFIRLLKSESQTFKIWKSDFQNLKDIYNKKIYNKKINIYDFETFWKEYPHARKWKKAESKKYFNQQDSEEVRKQVQILKRQIKAWLQDSERLPACERWIRDFTPLNEDVIKQKLVKIVKWHLNSGGDMKERSQQLKETFGEQTINEVVKSVQQNNSTINLKFN